MEIHESKTIVCDVCGNCYIKTEDMNMYMNESGNMVYVEEIDILPGYGSVLDNLNITLHICDDCLVNMTEYNRDMSGIDELRKNTMINFKEFVDKNR
ncbi:MAG: hypothetical protein ACOCRO_10800 [Halanaerobiales bacterium]